MLNILVCAPDEGACDPVLNAITQCLRNAGNRGEIIARDGRVDRLLALVREFPATLLTLIETLQDDAHLAAKVSLAASAQAVNRENQLLLVLESLQQLVPFVNGDARPNGVIIPSAGMHANEPLIQGIVERACSAQPADSTSVTIKVGAGSRRLPLSDLIYVEACGKHICLYTPVQCFTVIGSLKEMKEKLGDGFLQCHRSYLVNRDHIRSADYNELLLHLSHDMAVPIARTQKAEIKSYMNGGL